MSDQVASNIISTIGKNIIVFEWEIFIMMAENIKSAVGLGNAKHFFKYELGMSQDAIDRVFSYLDVSTEERKKAIGEAFDGRYGN